jgi:flagellar biosynthesis/type III secretory pathway chaperone
MLTTISTLVKFKLNKAGWKEIGWDGMDWTDLAQDRDQWRALVNTVMKLRVLELHNWWLLKKGSVP